MELIKHIMAIAAVIVVFAILFFPKRSFTEQFLDDANALRDSIKNTDLFDRDVREHEIADLVQMYTGRIEENLWKEKLNEVYKAFNNRAVKVK